MLKKFFSGLRVNLERVSVVGSTNDIATLISRLMHPSGYGFLVIRLNEQDDFIQCSGDPKGIQVNIPLITPRQIELESKIHIAINVLGLQLSETKGSDGSRFLDININGEAPQVSIIMQSLVYEVFGVTSSNKLRFDGELIVA